MVFDWIHYLDLADELVATLPEQLAGYDDVDRAAIRCSISKAYYAAYWHSRRYLENRFYDFRVVSDSHTTVIRRMQDEPGELASIGDQLNKLRIKRVKADYKIRETFSRGDAESGLIVAKQIIARIDQLN